MLIIKIFLCKGIKNHTITQEDYYKYSDMIDNMLKKQERLKNAVYQSLPQRALAREYRDLIKKGDIVLVYPQGRTKEKIVEVIKEGVKDKAMHNHMFGNTDYQTISAKDFEKMVLEPLNRIIEASGYPKVSSALTFSVGLW